MTEDVGLRIDVSVSNPNCPIHEIAAESTVSTEDIARSVTQNGDRITEEFHIDEDHAESVSLDVDTETFRYAGQQVYRFSRAADRPCFCGAVEAFDRPLTNIHIADDCLYGSFLAVESEDIGSMIRALHDEFDVSVRRIVHEGVEHPDNLVVLDRGVLTDRQAEALRTAHEMKYFRVPKGSNGGEVAEELGISRSTFLAHLNKAQDKLLDTVLSDDFQSKAA